MLSHINTEISQFVTLVSMNCPGGLTFVKKRVICQVIQDFLKKTLAWREDLKEISLTVSDEGSLDVAHLARLIAPNTLVWDVNDVRLSGDKTPLGKTYRDMMDKNIPDWQDETTDTYPSRFFLVPQRELVFYPMLASGADAVDVDIELILLPKLTAVKFPSFLYDFYGEAIAAGVSQKLCSQRGSAHYDPNQARYFLAVYREALNDARNAQAKRAIDALNAKRRRSYR